MLEIVLVIDDDPLLATLGEALTTDDTTAVRATGPDALRKLQDGVTPDVIVIDIDTRDGCLLLAQLEYAMNEVIPVVALSSRPRRLLEAGIADAVVMKPFEIGRLRTCIRRACDDPRGAA